ncbi:hypothetical protein DL93DRAFT_1632997 [Clavulina sp. PMI_390]|nr:hypothetical protein DL93DRAFT_1632997 [Clavulina sp. PMI_390]
MVPEERLEQGVLARIGPELIWKDHTNSSSGYSSPQKASRSPEPDEVSILQSSQAPVITSFLAVTQRSVSSDPPASNSDRVFPQPVALKWSSPRSSLSETYWDQSIGGLSTRHATEDPSDDDGDDALVESSLLRVEESRSASPSPPVFNRPESTSPQSASRSQLIKNSYEGPNMRDQRAVLNLDEPISQLSERARGKRPVQYALQYDGSMMEIEPLSPTRERAPSQSRYSTAQASSMRSRDHPEQNEVIVISDEEADPDEGTRISNTADDNAIRDSFFLDLISCPLPTPILPKLSNAGVHSRILTQ